MWLLMWRAVLSWRRGHRFLPLLIKVSFRVSFLSNIIGAGIISPQHSLLCQWEYFMSSCSRSTNSFQKVWTCSRVLTNNWVSGWRTMYCIRLHQQFVEGMRLSFSNINHRKKNPYEVTIYRRLRSINVELLCFFSGNCWTNWVERKLSLQPSGCLVWTQIFSSEKKALREAQTGRMI